MEGHDLLPNRPKSLFPLLFKPLTHHTHNHTLPPLGHCTGRGVEFLERRREERLRLGHSGNLHVSTKLDRMTS